MYQQTLINLTTSLLLTSLVIGCASIANKGVSQSSTDKINPDIKPVVAGSSQIDLSPASQPSLSDKKPTRHPKVKAEDIIIWKARDDLLIMPVQLPTSGEIKAYYYRAERLAALALLGKLVKIPAGSFRMGDIQGSGDSDEKPVHRVTIAKSFYMMAREVTFKQWDACVADGGCSYKPNDAGWGRGNRPVINVNYTDISKQFIPWLNRKTGTSWRLPSESEWEYAARAGSITKYSYGNDESKLCQYANGADRSTDFSLRNESCSDGYKNTAPVGSFKANKWDLWASPKTQTTEISIFNKINP